MLCGYRPKKRRKIHTENKKRGRDWILLSNRVKKNNK